MERLSARAKNSGKKPNVIAFKFQPVLKFAMSVMKAYRIGFGAAPRNESFMKLRSHGRFRMFFVLHWSIDCCSAKRVLMGKLLR